MNDAKELKQVYDIFTAAWRIYKAHYPPKEPEDDKYWTDLLDAVDKAGSEYDSRLCCDVLCAVASDLERKAKNPQYKAAELKRSIGK